MKYLVHGAITGIFISVALVLASKGNYWSGFFLMFFYTELVHDRLSRAFRD